jgi:hypothetical protein
MLIRRNSNGDALGPEGTELQPPSAAAPGLRERAITLLQTRGGGWIVAGVALAFCLPSLALGLLVDDHVFRNKARLGFDPFGIFEISRAQAVSARNFGQLAWWTSPELSIDFLRPLSALSHLAEFQFWPNAAWAMHLANGLIYAALVAVVWLLYRELWPQSPRSAALAALLFAIDDGHAPTIGWISSRNTLLATLFALSALLLHVRARNYASAPRVSRALGRQLRLHWASALCVALALFSAEAGIAVMAYLVAYALAFESGNIRERVITLLPELVVVVCWAVVYVVGGFGAHGASFYRDLSDPLSVFGQGVLDLPTWLFSLFGPSVIGTLMVLPPAPVRAVMLLLCLPILIGLASAMPRTRQNVFFAVGALLCLPPLFTTLPQDRLLVAASFGAFGLIASFVTAAATSPHRSARATRIGLIALHLIVSPLLFVPTLGQSRPIDNGARDIAAEVRERAPSRVVFVNLPVELLSLYSWHILHEDLERPHPSSMQQLYAGTSPLEVQRVDVNTLELRALKGWGERPVERIFCAPSDLPRAGTKLEFEPMKISVMDSDAAGHPVRVQFRFPDALESPGRLWLSWRGTKPVPWQPPAIGQTVSLEPLSMFTSLAL